MIIDFDEGTCIPRTENNKTTYNIGCKIQFRCKDENKKREYILTEGENSAECLEDSTWGERYWPACDRGSLLNQNITRSN